MELIITHNECKTADGGCVSADTWLKEAKACETASQIGMYLTHNGVVRRSAKAKVRAGAENTKPVCGMEFSYNEEMVKGYAQEAIKMDGIYYIRLWLAQGKLHVGDDIMYVLIGGDIRPHVVDCLQTLVGNIKSYCVDEIESY